MAYFYIKLIHVIFVIIFLGNITIGLFWKIIAEKTKDPDKIAFAFKGIIKADRYFTVPGVIGITLFGIGLASNTRWVSVIRNRLDSLVNYTFYNFRNCIYGQTSPTSEEACCSGFRQRKI